MSFADLTGATVVEADGAGIQLRLSDGRVAEVFPTTEQIGDLECPTLFIHEEASA